MVDHSERRHPCRADRERPRERVVRERDASVSRWAPRRATHLRPRCSYSSGTAADGLSSRLAPPSTRKFAVLSSVSCPGTRRCYAVAPLSRQEAAPARRTVGRQELVTQGRADPQHHRRSRVRERRVSEQFTLLRRWIPTQRQGHNDPGRTLERVRLAPVASPNPGGSSDTSLTAVSCATATSCVAIGSSHSNGTTRPIAERWDGTRWSLTGPLAAAGPAAQVTRIVCIGATNCTAVGRAVLNAATAPLVERWNGARWSIEASISRRSVFQLLLRHRVLGHRRLLRRGQHRGRQRHHDPDRAPPLAARTNRSPKAAARASGSAGVGCWASAFRSRARSRSRRAPARGHRHGVVHRPRRVDPVEPAARGRRGERGPA